MLLPGGRRKIHWWTLPQIVLIWRIPRLAVRQLLLLLVGRRWHAIRLLRLSSIRLLLLSVGISYSVRLLLLLLRASIGHRRRHPTAIRINWWRRALAICSRRRPS